MLQTTYQPHMVDIVFPIEGTTISKHYSHDLQNALQTELPWITAEERFSIHPIKLVTGDSEITVLSRRAQMIVRGPRERYEEIKSLSGKELNLSGHLIRLGNPHEKELTPHSTLYAHHVFAANASESDFMTKVSEELQILGIGGERVCGKRHRYRPKKWDSRIAYRGQGSRLLRLHAGQKPVGLAQENPDKSQVCGQAWLFRDFAKGP